MKNKYTYLLLIILLFVGFFLRTYNLDSQSMWIDESHTIRYSIQDKFSDSLELIRLHDGTPPLYYFFIWHWTKLFGYSEFSFRFLSVIFGMLSIIIIYLLGKDIVDSKVGIISALFLSLSMIHVLYSQEARSYALFTLLTLTSSLFFLKAIKKDLIKDWILYTLFTILLFYTHYLSIYIFLIQFISLIIFKRRYDISFKKSIISFCFIFVSCLPLIIFLTTQIHEAFAYFYDILALKLHLPEFIARLGLINFILPLIFICMTILYLLFSKKTIKKIKKLTKNITFNPTLFLITMILFLILSVLTTPYLDSSNFLTRYTHFFYGFIYIFFAWGITKLNRLQQTILVILIIITSAASLAIYHTDSTRKEQWREASTYIRENSKNDDIILINSISLTTDYGKVLLHYYGVMLMQEVLIGSKNYTEMENSFEKIEPKLKSATNVWLLLSHSYLIGNFYNKKLEQEYKLIKTVKYKGIDLYYYTKKAK